MDPLERGDLVHHAVVAGLALLGRQFGVGQEAEGAQAVVDGDEDDAPLRPFVSVHGHFVAVAVHECAAVDPEGDGKSGFRLADGLGRGPDVQVQAVLALLRCPFPVELVAIEGTGRIAGLPGDAPERVAGTDAFPRLHRLWCLPAEAAHGRGGIRDAFEDGDLGVFGGDALDLPAGNGDDGDSGRAGGQERNEGQCDQFVFHGMAVFCRKGTESRRISQMDGTSG